MRRHTLVGVIVLALSAGTASAHIHLTYPLARHDGLTVDLKEQHCGFLGWVRADNPGRTSYFTPGQQITVTWLETIQHPGWFRIAFQPDGEIFPIPPPENGPCSQPGAPGCNTYPVTSQQGVDPATGTIVLADRIADGTLSLDVTLPDIECNNCTLQMVQVMIDKPPYTADVNSDDIYFNCADITLTSTPPPDAAPGSPDATPGSPDAAGNPGQGGSGGCSATAGGPSGILTALAVVGLLGWRRRDRVSRHSVWRIFTA